MKKLSAILALLLCLNCPLRADNENYTKDPLNLTGVILSSATTSTAFPNTGTWGDLISLYVPPGTVALNLNASANSTGATVTLWEVGLGTAATTDGGGLTRGLNYAVVIASSTNIAIPGYSFTSSGGQTIYFKMRATYSAGTPTISGQITAIGAKH